jgi:hypothetical protein
MTTFISYPVLIQADNEDAADSRVPCMCHVFDNPGAVCVFAALAKQYLHVISWDSLGNKLREHDSR